MQSNQSGWQEEWQTFWLAVCFLTRVPSPVQIDYSQQRMNNSSVYFPIVGLFLGAIYAGAYLTLHLAFSPLVSVLVVMILHLWLTGAFHEDGLADSIDALGGGYTLEDRLRIMKDSRIGTYGTVALVMALALKAALLRDADIIWLALLVAPCISRLTPLLLMRALPYVTSPDKSKTRPVAESFSLGRLAISTGFTLIVLVVITTVIPGFLGTGILATAGVAVLWGGYLKKQMGGYTGDTLGACVIFSELVVLAGCL